MTTETLIILLTFVLALVYYLMPAYFAVANSGLLALAGSRDDVSVGEKMAAQRAERANANFKETVPWAIGLLILVQVTGDANGATALGGWIYLICRVLYIPLYLMGIPFARSIVWTISIVGLIMIAWQLL
ncbi:MAG: MAPEG family protein [Chloroflexota bacterium]